MPASSERDRVAREIAVTDEKIDGIVYELYELTDKNVAIIGVDR